MNVGASEVNTDPQVYVLGLGPAELTVMHSTAMWRCVCANVSGRRPREELRAHMCRCGVHPAMHGVHRISVGTHPAPALEKCA